MNLNAQRMPATQPAQQDDGLSSLWWSTVRYRWWIATIVAAFTLIGTIYALAATPQYRAEALLRIQTKPGAAISALSDVSGTISTGPSANDESEILTSRSIVLEAIEQTGAGYDIRTESHFPLIGRLLASRRANDDTLAAPLLGLSSYAWGGEALKLGVFSIPDDALGEPFRIVAEDGGRWTLRDKAGHPLAQGALGETVPFRMNLAGAEQAGEIRVDTLRARPGIAFSVRKEPEQLAYDDVSKRLKTVVTNRDSTLEAPSMMRLSYQSDTARHAEQMVNAIVAIYLRRDLAFRTDKARRNLDSLHARLPGLKKDLQKAEDALNRYRTATGTIDVDQQGAALIARLNTLAEHQTVLQLALDTVKERFLPASREYQTVMSQLNLVKGEIRDTTAAAGKLPTAQREYVRLSRDVAVATQLYTSVLTNSQQLDIAVASTAPGVSVVDWAAAPYRPTWPRRGLVVLGAMLGGLFVALVLTHLLARYRRELYSPLALAALSDRPCVAVVAASPALRDQRRARYTGPRLPDHLLAASLPRDPSIESLRALRTSLKAAFSKRRRGGAGKVLLFTGPTANVGCSFMASNLAYLLAEVNARVLLVDANLRDGATATARESTGLADVLAGAVPLDAAIAPLDKSRLSILGPGTADGVNPGELFDQPAFRELLATLRARYDYVIVDAPPVLPYSDTLSIASEACDMILLVSRAGLTRASELEAALQRLASVGASVAGHVFNADTDTSAQGADPAWRARLLGLTGQHASLGRKVWAATAGQALALTKKTVAGVSRN
ncbi:GNVR domain-containing protein [Burkholderia alba]|uniref:GNVR domain-containing protein n=1 Tax=Burkholderia alba TaxID=2683677 RepID=UPI002B051CC4|nr:GNVR domain-containing protein [Burkholderia alba]